MQSPGEDSTKLTRRALMLGASQLGLLSVLAGRLYYLQVVRSEEFAIRAEENRVNIGLIAPRRGRVLDRFGKEIATNRPNFQVVLIPEQAQKPFETIARLEKIIPISARRKRRLLRDIPRTKGFVPFTVAENLTWEQFSKVNIHLPHLPGLETSVGEMRFYPEEGPFAHIVGYVGVPNREDLLEEDPLLKLEGFRVGKSGIESRLDEELRGTAGSRQVEVNNVGRVIRELSRDPSISGDDVVLTLDAELQKYALDRMGDQSGSVAVMEINSGDILVLASNPYFDPNDFNLGISQKEWDRLVSDQTKPLLNKSIAGQYAPGSTFKMLVALAGLQEGVITPEEKITCTAKYDYGKDTFHCWFDEGHGPMDMHGAIKHSCDVYFYELARRIGIEPIARMARKFGLGEKTNIEATGEKQGLVPSKDWKRANLDSLWQKGETLITGIGQGYLLATPLQLAGMVSSLANGQRQVQPNLIYAVGGSIKTMPETPALNIDQGHLALIHDAMKAVTHDADGTAFMPDLNVDGRRMAGKTGTVQVRRITAAEREAGIIKNEELDWHLRDHALFVGFAPVDSPKYAISVVVEHGGSGSKAAAPIARDIMREVLQRDPQARDVYLPDPTQNAGGEA
ncbi:MAG: penicillin-binding protein 2 [Parvibaculales bacterium]